MSERVADLEASLRQMCAEYEIVAKRAGYPAEHNYSYRQAQKLLAIGSPVSASESSSALATSNINKLPE